MLQQPGKSLSDLDMTLPDIPVPNLGEANCLITKELSYHKLRYAEMSTLVHQLNTDQRRVYNAFGKTRFCFPFGCFEDEGSGCNCRL